MQGIAVLLLIFLSSTVTTWISDLQATQSFLRVMVDPAPPALGLLSISESELLLIQLAMLWAAEFLGGNRGPW